MDKTGCFNCGGGVSFTFPAGMTKILSSLCGEGCNTTTNLECDNCHNPFLVYWCTGHPSHAGGPIGKKDDY